MYRPRLHPFLARSFRAGGALVLLLCGACSHQKPQPPELSGVYQRIHESWQDYDDGIGQILAGNDMAGENLLAAATTRLVVAARECARTPGCDPTLFEDAMEQLVAERRMARATAEPPPAGAEEPLLADAEAAAEPESLEAASTPAARSLLTGAALDELIPLNAQVQAALNDWLTWNRPGLIEAWRNYLFLRPAVAPIYEESELPEALLFAIMAQESGAKVHAYSRAGAAGPLQFMYHTARRYGLGSVDGFDTRLDPVAATEANAKYVRYLLRRFDGSLELALAAYNVGETRLRKLRRRHGGADFWDPRIARSLPWETRDYVPKVLAAAWLFMHPEDHALEFPVIENNSTTIVLVEEASLGELSVCLGQAYNTEGWFRTLRNLNPRLSTDTRAAKGSQLRLPTRLVPVYSAQCVGDNHLRNLARELHDADYPEKPDVLDYTVRSGDTLAAIAARHRCTLRELADLNGIRGPDFVIVVGQRIMVPASG